MPKKIKAIQIKTTSTHWLNINWLEPSQGAFKELTDAERHKLENEIIEQGILEPWQCWEYEPGKFKIMDGHQRTDVVLDLMKRGKVRLADSPDGKVETAVPANLTIIENEHEEDNETEAALINLALGSTFGKPQPGGMKKLAKRAGITYEEAQLRFTFPGINNVASKGPKETTDWKGAKVVKCPKCEQQFYQKNHLCQEPEESEIWGGVDD